MPQVDKHLDIIESNHKALAHLVEPDPSQYTDWCVTIIFYMALHYIHAYLAKTSNEHPDSHASLQPLIRNDPQIKPLYLKYRHLEDDSRKARYDGEMLTIPQLRNESLRWFKDIQSSVFRLLKLTNRQEFDLYSLFPLSSQN